MREAGMSWHVVADDDIACSGMQRLGEFLPLAIMTLLVVHSAAGSAQQHAGGPWPELAAVALTVAVQWRSRNALLSIALGTALYVALRNFTGI